MGVAFEWLIYNKFSLRSLCLCLFHMKLMSERHILIYLFYFDVHCTLLPSFILGLCCTYKELIIWKINTISNSLLLDNINLKCNNRIICNTLRDHYYEHKNLSDHLQQCAANISRAFEIKPESLVKAVISKELYL